MSISLEVQLLRRVSIVFNTVLVDTLFVENSLKSKIRFLCVCITMDEQQKTVLELFFTFFLLVSSMLTHTTISVLEFSRRGLLNLRLILATIIEIC